MTREGREKRDTEEKEAFRRRIEARIQAWFESPESGCDFWSECDAPAQLADVIIDELDAFVKEADEAYYR